MVNDRGQVTGIIAFACPKLIRLWKSVKMSRMTVSPPGFKLSALIHNSLTAYEQSDSL